MKPLNINYKVIGSIAAMIVLSSASLHAQTNPADSTRIYLDKLVASKDAADKSTLDAKLQQLAASNSEKEMDMAINYYFRLNKNRISDSLVLAQITRFPRTW